MRKSARFRHETDTTPDATPNLQPHRQQRHSSHGAHIPAIFRQGATITTALHELIQGWPDRWHEATKPASEHGHAADAKASHKSANTLPAYSTRRHAQEEPGRLRLAPLPWSNTAPDRPAPEQPPGPQIAANDLDIKGVGKLAEWDGIASAVDNIRKDFAFSNNKKTPQAQSRRRHRREHTTTTDRRYDPGHQEGTRRLRHYRLGQSRSPRLDESNAEQFKPPANKRNITKLQRQRIFIRIRARRQRHEPMHKQRASQLASQRCDRIPRKGACNAKYTNTHHKTQQNIHQDRNTH